MLWLDWNLLFASVLVRLLTAGRVRPSFGRWDLARTQSGTRIATTASPVPAISLDPRDYRLPAASQPAAVPTLLQPDPIAVAPPSLGAPLAIDQAAKPCPRRYFGSTGAVPAEID